MIDKEEKLYEWLPHAQNMARAFAKRNSRMDVDDVESAAMMAVVEAIERYDGTTPFDGWCKVTVKRRVLDLVRRYLGRSGKDRRGRSVTTTQLPSERLREDSAQLSDWALRDRRAVSACELQPADWLDAAIAGLWPREQKILRMRLDGHTMAEAAAAVGLSESMGWHAWQSIATHIATALGCPDRARDAANCFKKKR